MIMSRKMNTNVCYTSAQEIKGHSFSSTLLEAVYRSIDREEQPDIKIMFGEEKVKKQTGARDSCSKREEIEKWMEKRTVSSGFHENPRRRTLEVNKVIDEKMLSTAMGRNCSDPVSSSHSSDSSLSVERDCSTTISKIPKSKSTNSGYQMPHPIRAMSNNKVQHHNGGESSSHFVKTKSHALKFYKEIKKMKQPISPGGRIATLINSLFLTGHSKKAKYTNVNDHPDHVGGHLQTNDNNNNKSTCSSASSFSRSCLSHKTSSSSASSTNKGTRSVRFSSSNLTVFNEQKPVIKMDESCDVTENDIQALLRKYHKEDLFAIFNEIEEDNDGASSSTGSSDLFELDHLMGPFGMEELPVYATTTRLDANRPIANSLLA